MLVDLETETIRSSSNLEDWKFFIVCGLESSLGEEAQQTTKTGRLASVQREFKKKFKNSWLFCKGYISLNFRISLGNSWTFKRCLSS